MAIIIDVIIVAILAICVLIGYKRGLTGCLINILAFFIALVLAFALFKPASEVVRNNTLIDENIQYSIVKVFESDDSKDNQEENSSPIMKHISEEVQKATEDKKNEIVNSAATEFSIKIIDILSFITIFVVSRIILIFIKALTGIITKLPIVKQCDKIGGVIYGILQGLVIIFIAFAIITFISTMIDKYTLLEIINQSYIGRILCNNNILLKVIF